jgi:hypothetical protein
MEAKDFSPQSGSPPPRPVYLILALWGKKYCDYFCSLCAPALLAPRNVPALKGRPGSKILVATTSDDWADLQTRPVVKQLAEYVELLHIDIGMPGDSDAQLHSAKGHRLGCRMAYEDGAIAGWITPDLLMSDGLIENSLALLDGGKKIVRFPALRSVMEPILQRLQLQGLLRADGPMALAPDVLSDIAIGALHPELLRYEFDCPEFHDYPLWTFWRVPERRGLILYTVSWGFIADFRAARYEDASFDYSTIDGFFPNDTFGYLPASEIGLVNDSGVGLFMGLTPREDLVFDNEPARRANRFYGRFGLGAVKRMKDIHRLHYRPEIDNGRRFLHLIPFVLHADALDSRYREIIRSSQRLMELAAAPDYRSLKLSLFDFVTITSTLRPLRPVWICVLVAAHISGDVLAGRKTLKYCAQRILEECGLKAKTSKRPTEKTSGENAVG